MTYAVIWLVTLPLGPVPSGIPGGVQAEAHIVRSADECHVKKREAEAADAKAACYGSAEPTDGPRVRLEADEER